LNRAAAFVFGASLAVAGCSSDIDTGGSGGGGGAGGNGQETDAGPDDDGGAMTLYGLPPPDAGMMDAPADDGGNFPLYGLPPPMDAGND